MDFPAAPPPIGPLQRVTILGVAFELGLGVVALGLGRLIGAPATDTLSWSASAVGLGIAATVPMLAAFGYLMRSRWPVLEATRRVVVPWARVVFAPCSWLELVALTAAAGIGEELLFRGLAQGGLAPRIGPIPALLVASLVFGLAHAVTLVYAIVATLLGLYLGWVWWMTGNLLVVIVAHAFYDLVAIEWIRRRDPGPAASEFLYNPDTTD